MSGSLLSHDAIERLLSEGQEAGLAPERWAGDQARLRRWHAGIRHTLGPATGPRTVFDLVATPLAETLGFSVLPLSGGSDTVDGGLRQSGSLTAVLIASAWGRPPRTLWRHAVQRSLAHGVRWALCANGPSLCVFDAERAYARRFVEFDLAAAFESVRSLAVLCGLAGAAGLRTSADGSALERAMAHTERHRSMVRLSLRSGVHQAVVELVAGFRAASGNARDSSLRDEALVVVYRVLFLLFAEARKLVPTWHPVYRHGYSIESVRAEIERSLPRGLWEALQAVARLAHRGCSAGALKVPPFNGRLFSPAHAPLAAKARLDDRTVAAAIGALTTRVDNGRREEIAYADLGVEQLGGVYEHLLDFDFSTADAGGSRTSGRAQRKATGTFYTPRPLTEFIVRRTLGPVVEGRTADGILALRVLDPAMGSGAFLVAACRYLAAAYENALIREGVVTAADLTANDRAGFRRAVAQRCLYGVDVNPMAVQLARLSLWLATLAADKPLTFLDHRLRAGHSLIGASLDDLAREPAVRVRRPADLPLFGDEAVQRTFCAAVGVRLHLAEVPDDTLEQVRAKERSCSSLESEGGPLERWRAAADLWCAAFLDGTPARGSFAALRDHVFGRGPLPGHIAAPLVARGRAAAARERVFHWSLEFPEIFYDDRGLPLPNPGFDIVLGNPPWEMLRGEGESRAGLIVYAKGSGQYRLQGEGHTNLYQLFFERGLRLLKHEGRCGLILPAGFAGDHGSGVMRRHLFDRAQVETFTTIDNRDGIFPIHRGLRFLLLTFRAGGQSSSVPLRAGVRSAETLEGVADTGEDPEALALPRALVERVGGESLAVPEVRTEMDLRILTSITLRVPALSAAEGWGVRFGRELNATDDRPHFTQSGGGMPVIEGKQLGPFRIAREEVRFWIAPEVAGRLLEAERTFARNRLAYRDVAGAGNRLTLIAAIVPAGLITTHTLFCLKTDLEEEAQAFLCGVLNSYVANFLIRMRVGTHVTTAIVARLPVPKPSRSDRRFGHVAACAHSLTLEPDGEVVAAINGVVASLYGLEIEEFEHVLGTFPLIPAADREAALRAFVDQDRGRTGYHSCFQ